MKQSVKSQENDELAELNLTALSDDCLFEILNRLPTNYLYTIAETCTRLFDVAAIEYRRRHPNKFACLSMFDEKIVLHPNDYDVQTFGRKFLNLIIRGNGRNHQLSAEFLEYIILNCSSNLKMLRFEEMMLKTEQLQIFKHMLYRTETLVLHKCGMIDDFYDSLLRYCHNLKHLIISDTYTQIGSNEMWLFMKYPVLESVHLCSVTMVSFQSERWTNFFHQNQQIKRFSCDHWYSIEASDRPIKIIAQNLPKLTHLYISLRGIGHLNSTYYDLSVLCQKQTFQSIEIQCTGTIGQQYLNRHSKILCSMTKLHALHLTDTTLTKETAADIISIANLKKLNFVNSTFDTDFAEMISKKLLVLEEIYADVTNDFIPFILNTPKLQKIVLSNTAIGELNLGWGLNWLNSERMKCKNASPLTIFVHNISSGDAEVQGFSNGLITIQSIAIDKRIISQVNNTFRSL